MTGVVGAEGRGVVDAGFVLDMLGAASSDRPVVLGPGRAAMTGVVAHAECDLPALAWFAFFVLCIAAVAYFVRAGRSL